MSQTALDRPNQLPPVVADRMPALVAGGALVFGFIVDRVGAFWLYPMVLIGWSLAGVATAYADEIGAALLGLTGSSTLENADSSKAAYLGFLSCRIVLGFFEAGHWPCALVTTQTILSRQDRSFGNSILQSGAAIGAIFTPIIVVYMVHTHVGVAGATGFAGQELVRLMARHPHAQIAAAMASSASSPARTLPALDRIWNGSIVPFDLPALADAAEVVLVGHAGAAPGGDGDFEQRIVSSER